jgi:hypothetical protein
MLLEGCIKDRLGIKTGLINDFENCSLPIDLVGEQPLTFLDAIGIDKIEKVLAKISVENLGEMV